MDAEASHWLGWAKKEVARLAEVMPAFIRTWVHGDVTVRAQYHEESGIARLWLEATGVDWIQEGRFELSAANIVFARSSLILLYTTEKLVLLWRDDNGKWGGRGRSEAGEPLTDGDELPSGLLYMIVYVSDDGTKIMYYVSNTVVIRLYTATWDGSVWDTSVAADEELYYMNYSNLFYQMDEAKQAGVILFRTDTNAVTPAFFTSGVKTVRAEMPVSISSPTYCDAGMRVHGYSRDRVIFSTTEVNGEASSWTNIWRVTLEEQTSEGVVSVLYERRFEDFYSSWTYEYANSPYYVYDTKITASGDARTIFVYNDDQRSDLSPNPLFYTDTRTVEFTVRSCVSGTWLDVFTQTGTGINEHIAAGGYLFNIVKSYDAGESGQLWVMYESNGNGALEGVSGYTYNMKYTCYCYVGGQWRRAVLYTQDYTTGTAAYYSLSFGFRNGRGASDYAFIYRMSSPFLPPYFGGTHDAALVSWVDGEFQQVTTFQWDSNSDIRNQFVISKDGRTAFFWAAGGVKQLWSCAITGEWKQVFSRTALVENYTSVRISDDGRTVVVMFGGGGVSCWSCVPGEWVEVTVSPATVGFVSLDGVECLTVSGSTPTTGQIVKFIPDVLQKGEPETALSESVSIGVNYYVQREDVKVYVAKRRTKAVQGEAATGKYTDDLISGTVWSATSLDSSGENGVFSSSVSAGFGQSMRLKQLPTDVSDGAMKEARYVPPDVVGEVKQPRRLVVLYDNAVRIFKRLGKAAST